MARLLDRTVGFLADRLDRRGFLGKAAVVGSAVVAAPLEFGLRPTSAYAAICRCNGSSCPCGSLCCDGYTEFCCTLYGANACPAGTLTAGWWKVDGSQFCGGAARYYLDCNAACGSCSCGANGVCSGACSGTPCGCAKGSCNNRKAGCTRFRYGQCNQGVRCVGPIVCRVVTCAPPWTFDPTCGTSARTDAATAFHNRPCLNEPFGALDSVTDAGGALRVRGWAVANTDYRNAKVRIYVDGKVVVDTLAVTPRPDVSRAYPAVGPEVGYDHTIAVRPGTHQVSAWATDRRTGRQTLLGAKDVKVAGPIARVESVTDLGGGRLRVVGWAIDPSNRTNRRAVVRVRLDGREVQRGPTTVARRDVATRYANAHPTSGFSVVVRAAAGAHRVCVDVVDARGTATQISCVDRQAVPSPSGNIDQATSPAAGQVRLVGWTIDPLRGAGPARLRVTVDGVQVYTGTAALARPDIVAAHPGFGADHGFDITLPVAAGDRRICVEVVHDGGARTSVGCRTVTVGA